MKRVDWRLVAPLKEGCRDDEGLAEQLDEWVERAAFRPLSAEEQAEVARLETRQGEITTGPCDAVSAPRVEDDPDWESRVIDEYAESELDMELEEYLDLRRVEPDCERCPYASPYSLYPMDPCEFSAGGCYEILTDQRLLERLEQPMTPAEMRTCADALEALAHGGGHCESAVLDAADYLDKAALFLRFWASYGFGVRPESLELVPLEADPGGAGEHDGEPPTMH